MIDNKGVGNWLKRYKWWLVGAVIVAAGLVYVTGMYGTPPPVQ